MLRTKAYTGVCCRHLFGCFVGNLILIVLPYYSNYLYPVWLQKILKSAEVMLASKDKDPSSISGDITSD
jgi:hypothetical protein